MPIDDDCRQPPLSLRCRHCHYSLSLPLSACDVSQHYYAAMPLHFSASRRLFHCCLAAFQFSPFQPPAAAERHITFAYVFFFAL
jgi:hypothetical protein